MQHADYIASILMVQSSANQDKEKLAKASSGARLSAKVLSKPLVPHGQSNEPRRAVSVYRQGRSYGQAFSLEYSKTNWKTFGRETSNLDLIEEETSFLIGSPLFGLHAKLSVRRGPFSPWGFAIEIPHVIDFSDHRIFDIIESDNLLLFQRALDDGLIRSNTVMRFPFRDTVLFEVSALQLIDQPCHSGNNMEDGSWRFILTHTLFAIFWYNMIQNSKIA